MSGRRYVHVTVPGRRKSIEIATAKSLTSMFTDTNKHFSSESIHGSIAIHLVGFFLDSTDFLDVKSIFENIFVLLGIKRYRALLKQTVYFSTPI